MSGWPAQLLDDAQRLAWLRLWRSENIGPTLFYQLIDHFGSAGAALEAMPEMARRGGRRKAVRVCPQQRAEAELEQLRRMGAILVARGEAGYPPLLAHSAAPPPLLTLRGQAELAGQPLAAIVGSRNASANGRLLAQQLAGGLVAEGYGIVSGLARGIDGAAHEGALAAAAATGGPSTIAVLACGIDVPYPREHAALMERIAREGLLISEMPPGTRPARALFPRRNRLVAGMSLGVIVVEAARRSGSLITARLAAEEGRAVMAVPGSPLDGRAAGCNHLLREGAVLVRHARDAAETLAREAGQLKVALREPPPALPPLPGKEADVETLPLPADATPAPAAPDASDAPRESSAKAAPPPPAPPDSLREKLLRLMGNGPVDQDVLLRQADAPPAEALAALMELELAGRITRAPDGRLSLAAPPA